MRIIVHGTSRQSIRVEMIPIEIGYDPGMSANVIYQTDTTAAGLYSIKLERLATLKERKNVRYARRDENKNALP